MLLEESRIEAAHTRRRPDDRHWLRAATTELILADLTPPTPGPATHRPTPADGAEPRRTGRAPQPPAPRSVTAAALDARTTPAGGLTGPSTPPATRTADQAVPKARRRPGRYRGRPGRRRPTTTVAA